MGTGKKKIETKKISKESSRKVAFSKRRKGLFKKAVELESMTGAQVAILVFSQAGKPYTCGDVERHCSKSSGIISESTDTFDVETCHNVNELFMLMAHLERTREKLLESLFLDSLLMD